MGKCSLPKKKIDTKKLIYCALFASVMAVVSQLSIPMPSGVPITLQTFAAALCAYMLGTVYGTLAVAVWALIGLMGVPVFSNFTGGVGVLFGMTGGFITGFLPMCALCGLGIRHKKSHCAIPLGLVGLIVCHACGTAQFAIVSGSGFTESFLLVSAPYLIKDAVSVVLAYFAAASVKRRLTL